MKALTIAQPYAELIMRGLKPVENRTWGTNYRGPLLIHAGKSRGWMNNAFATYGDQLGERKPGEIKFGCIVGIATLAYVCTLQHLQHRVMYPHKFAPTRGAINFQAIAENRHTQGPMCWILTDARRFETPIEYRGAQGLFDVDEYVIAEEMQKLTAEVKS
jgi:hypothetical protein